MRLRTWLILGYSAVLALATLGLGLGLMTVMGVANTSGRMVEENFRALDVASRLRTLASAQQLVLVSRLGTGDLGTAQLMPPFATEARVMLDEARALGPMSQVEIEAIDRAERAVATMVMVVEASTRQRAQAFAQGSATDAGAAITPPAPSIPRELVGAFASLRAATLDYYNYHHDVMVASGNQIRRQSSRLAVALGLLAGFTVLVGVLASLRLAQRLSAPMERIAEAAARVAQGDFDVRVGRTGLSEADVVAERFDDMTAALARFHAMNLDRIVAESRRMDQVVAHIDAGLMLFDEQGRIERINPVACEQLGLTPERAVGHPLHEIADFPVLAEAVRVLIERPTAVLHSDNELHLGEEPAQRTLSWSLLPFSDAARVGLVLMLRDVTDARQFERMRTDFVLRASHELRTPITGMRMALGLLKGKLAFPPESREASLVSTLDEEMRRLANLITALLDLSRLYARSHALVRTPTDIGEMLERVHTRFLPMVESEGLSLTLELEPGLPPIDVDQTAMDRVFDNLLGNAIRHTPRDGRLVLGARRVDRGVDLWVSDSGEGIAHADRARVFEPFVQIGRRVGGVGLGLAMCREIVQQHGGRIRLDSAPMRGSRFTLSLPA